MSNKKKKDIEKNEMEIETEKKISELDLSPELIIECVNKAFKSVTNIKLPGTKVKLNGVNSNPQLTGSLLHEAIPIFIAEKTKDWVKGTTKTEKDLVYLKDDSKSLEIKTSSSKNDVYGNRSYGQEQSNKEGTKEKSGYYLTVNFDKSNNETDKPEINKIKLGYLDHSDWIPQKSAKGQQSRLTKEAKKYKLKEIYSKKKKDT